MRSSMIATSIGLPILQTLPALQAQRRPSIAALFK